MSEAATMRLTQRYQDPPGEPGPRDVQLYRCRLDLHRRDAAPVRFPDPIALVGAGRGIGGTTRGFHVRDLCHQAARSPPPTGLTLAGLVARMDVLCRPMRRSCAS